MWFHGKQNYGPLCRFIIKIENLRFCIKFLNTYTQTMVIVRLVVYISTLSWYFWQFWFSSDTDGHYKPHLVYTALVLLPMLHTPRSARHRIRFATQYLKSDSAASRSSQSSQCFDKTKVIHPCRSGNGVHMQAWSTRRLLRRVLHPPMFEHLLLKCGAIGGVAWRFMRWHLDTKPEAWYVCFAKASDI